jgi:hypothetical protein
MKKIITLLAVIAILLVGYFVFRTDGAEAPSGAKNTAVYSNPELQLEFTYKTGPDGYVVEERNPSQTTSGEVKTIILMRAEDKENLDKNGAPVGGEGPATITINILKNLKSRQASVWAMENVAYSNYNLKSGEPTEAVVGGANAVRYLADGLYASDTVVVASGGYIYVFTGMYLDENSALRRDFQPLIESVKFVPISSQVGGKINIDEVCQGALTYMTFPNGAAADKFVEDCKEGKHPEVIEKYKQDMNLGDGAAI